MAIIYYKGDDIYQGSPNTSFEDIAKWLEKEGVENVDIADFTMDYSSDDINSESRAYLASTDWYAVRLAENGTAIPADVLEKREAARVAIVD